MANNTAVILIDPYNDFLHPKGKVNPVLADSMKATGTIEHLQQLIKTARANKIPIFYCLHQQTDAYFTKSWQMMNPSLTRLRDGLVFEKGTWGAEIYEGMEPDFDNGDVIISKHWNSR